MSKKSQRKHLLQQYLNGAHFPLPLSQLECRFNTSNKTLRRDIEELSLEQQAPWYIFNNQVHCDQLRQQQFELDGYWLSAQELESLFALNAALEQLSKGVLTQQLQPIKQRLLTILGEPKTAEALVNKIKIIEIANRTIQNPLFNQITQALAENKRLQITYWKRHDNLTQTRQISPQQLVRYKDNWYLDAYCHQAKGLRSFSLDAIQQAKTLNETAEKITPDGLKTHFQSSYGIFNGQADKIAQLKFSPYISRWVQNETWHPKQTQTLEADGSLLLSLPYHHDTELIQDILKYGDQVEALAPAELREKIQAKLKNTLQKYAKDKNCPNYLLE